MKKLLALLATLLLISACEPMPVPADGLDAQADAVVSDSPEASSDALPPHVDGGGID